MGQSPSRRGTLALVLLAALAASLAGADAASVRLRVPSSLGEQVAADGFADRQLAELRAASAERLRETLAVFVDSGDEIPRMLGSVRLMGERLIFTPRLPFLPGQAYRVRLEVGGETLERQFELPREAPPPAGVAAIVPNVGRVPENLLRIYVHFDSAMRGGEAYRNIGLYDSRGERIEQALVETVPELWDRDRRRLTLVLHPGRIKRGLEMRSLRGPALRAGGSFIVRVEAGMRTAAGGGLGETHERRFEVVGADRRSPAIDRWRIESPTAGSREPLIVEFDEPLDRELLRRMVRVESADGEALSGRAEPAADGASWSYLPDRAWAAGRYEVAIHPALEDLAGNRLDRPFDVELAKPVEERVVELYRLPLRIE